LSQKAKDSRWNGNIRNRQNQKNSRQSSAGKLMLTIFLDSDGPVLTYFHPKGENINSARYSEMLRDKLKPAIRSKRRGRLSEGAILRHDNARSHTAQHTTQTLEELKFEVLQHPSYSPDLSSCDYFLFEPMKDELRGKHFPNNKAVKIF